MPTRIHTQTPTQENSTGEQPHTPKSLQKCNGTANWNRSIIVTHGYKNSPDPRLLDTTWALGRDTTKAERLQLLLNSHTASLALYQMLPLTLTKSKGLAMAATPRAAVQRWPRAKAVRWRHVKVIQEAQRVSLRVLAPTRLDVVKGGVDGEKDTKGKIQREIRVCHRVAKAACVNNTILSQPTVSRRGKLDCCH